VACVFDGFSQIGKESSNLTAPTIFDGVPNISNDTNTVIIFIGQSSASCRAMKAEKFLVAFTERANSAA